MTHQPVRSALGRLLVVALTTLICAFGCTEITEDTDAGVMPPGRDAGPPGFDAGPSGFDAGPPGFDAGPSGFDAGPPGLDAGPPGFDAGDGRPDVDFPGGSLADLRTYSTTLVFGRLRFLGALALDAAEDVSLDVEDFEITSGGSITYSQTSCSYLRAPNLTVRASGAVTIAGAIRLGGKSGTRSLDTATCNSCFGADGGDVDIEAATIDISATVDTGGGWSSSLVFSGGGGSIGCDGGDAGMLRLFATTRIDIDADFDTDGGRGGSGSIGGGDPGVHGTLAWQSPDTNIAERESNRSPSQAQVVPRAIYEVTGTISSTDDATGAGTPIVIDLGGGVTDRIEDLYRLRVQASSGAGGVTFVDLVAADAATDLDLFVMTTSGTVIEQGITSTGTERVVPDLAPGDYLIGVSWCCSTPPTAYTLTVSPGASL